MLIVEPDLRTPEEILIAAHQERVRQDREAEERARSAKAAEERRKQDAADAARKARLTAVIKGVVAKLRKQAADQSNPLAKWLSPDRITGLGDTEPPADVEHYRPAVHLSVADIGGDGRGTIAIQVRASQSNSVEAMLRDEIGKDEACIFGGRPCTAGPLVDAFSFAGVFIARLSRQRSDERRHAGTRIDRDDRTCIRTVPILHGFQVCTINVRVEIGPDPVPSDTKPPAREFAPWKDPRLMS